MNNYIKCWQCEKAITINKKTGMAFCRKCLTTTIPPIYGGDMSK